MPLTYPGKDTGGIHYLAGKVCSIDEGQRLPEYSGGAGGANYQDYFSARNLCFNTAGLCRNLSITPKILLEISNSMWGVLLTNVDETKNIVHRKISTFLNRIHGHPGNII